MEIRQLEIFLVAAQTLNFTKAASRLGYVQSNITSQIRQLEEELHVKLFERFNRGLALTREGERFRINAEKIMQLCEQAREDLSPEIFRGKLEIGAAESICVYRLPRLLTNYRSHHPLVDIHVLTESCDTLLSLLRTNVIDVALVLTDSLTAPDITTHILYKEPMALVASPDHPLSRKVRVAPADLSGHCNILSMPGCGYRPIILSLFQRKKIIPASFMELSSVGAIKECAVCGLGFSFLPRVSVAADLASGRLQELLWTGPSLNVYTLLIHHRDKWMSPALRAFLTLCHALPQKAKAEKQQ